jgi:hypothetical protein
VSDESREGIRCHLLQKPSNEKKTGSNLFTQVLICFRKKIKIRPEKKSLSGKAEVCPEKAEKPVRKS